MTRIGRHFADPVRPCRRRPRQRPKVLRYVSQRTDKAYLREGPTYAHKVLWVYRHRGYPFAVIAQFDIWRRVQAAGRHGGLDERLHADATSAPCW